MHALGMLIYQTDPFTLLAIGFYLGAFVATVVQVAAVVLADRRSERRQ